MSDSSWHKTSCILCSINCGVEVQLDGRRIARVRGDKEDPASLGYTCEKALRLDHYQNGEDRLTSPLRRRSDGTFEEIDWDTAIREVAQRLSQERDTHGGASIFYYGGGGQGNHLGGAYGRALRAACQVKYTSNALAQEKTGEFWVDGQLYGRSRCHTAPDLEHTQVAVFVGKNPWHSHGFPRARTILKQIAKDPARSLVVIDPRRTETADMADHFVQVRPGADAFFLAALLKSLVEQDLLDDEFLAARANRLDELLAALEPISVADYAERAGVPASQVEEVARVIGGAESVAIFEDLGIQQAPHSTLNSYLEKLAYVLTGNFGKRGGMNIHTAFASLGGSGPKVPGGGSGGGGTGRKSPVTEQPIITGLIPCNVLPDEILTDHPDRFRSMIVESANPAHSLADSPRMREALDALDFLVVIDVAMTETAKHADYVLPASSQFEKWEAVFFTLEFPDNDIQLRRPVLDPAPGTLPEPEIHARLVREMGVLDDYDLSSLHEAAKQGREAYAGAFFGLIAMNPELMDYATYVLYETLGPQLGEGNEGAAAMWGLSQLFAMAEPESLARAGFEGGSPIEQGDKLFEAMFSTGTGVIFSKDPYEISFERLCTADGKINLFVEPLIAELEQLAQEDPRVADESWPFVLAAGERRSFTANTIYRDPAWRKKDVGGALRMSPDDAQRLGVSDGGRVRVTTKRGSAETEVEVSDTLQAGHITLPNGLGLSYPDGNDAPLTGVAPNELTSTEDRDWFAGTPWHKHVRARVEVL